MLFANKSRGSAIPSSGKEEEGVTQSDEPHPAPAQGWESHRPALFCLCFLSLPHGTQNIHSVFGLHGNRISVLQLYYESGLCRCHLKGCTFGRGFYGCIHHPIIPRSQKGRRKKEVAILLSRSIGR